MTEASRSGPPATVPEQDDRQPEHVVGPFECFGQGFVIRTPDADLAGFVNELYSPLRSEIEPRDLVTYSLVPPRPSAPGRLSSDRGLMRASRDHDRLFSKLVWAINRQVIDGPSAHRLMFHAAAAELNGAGVLLPAPTGSGKTTLVTALLDRGFAYLTDEAAAVDEDLTIEGFPKPLSVERGSFEVLAHREPRTSDPIALYLKSQWQIPIERFAPVVPRARLDLIVFPTYEAGAGTSYESLRPASVVSEAFANLLVPQRSVASAEMVRQLTRIAGLVPAARLVYSDLGAACDIVGSGLRRAATRGPQSHQAGS